MTLRDMTIGAGLLLASTGVGLAFGLGYGLTVAGFLAIALALVFMEAK